MYILLFYIINHIFHYKYYLFIKILIIFILVILIITILIISIYKNTAIICVSIRAYSIQFRLSLFLSLSPLSISFYYTLNLKIFLAYWIKDLEETYVRSFLLVLILFWKILKFQQWNERTENFHSHYSTQREVNLRSREENLVAYKSPRFVFLV